MSKFKFKPSQQNSSSITKKDIDWNALQKHVIDTVDAQEESISVAGVISGIIDLGVQKRGMSENEFKGTKEDQEAEKAKNPAVVFKEKKGKTYICLPLKDHQCVAVTVDFPQFTVDKAKFFGESNPAPLRLVMNGEIPLNMITFKEEDKKTKVVQKGFVLKELPRDSDGEWSIDPKNTLYKLAEATKLIKSGDVLKKEDVGALIGRSALFEIRVFMRKYKDMEFYTENIRLSGKIPKGIPEPVLDEKYQYMVLLNEDNDEAYLKQLRLSLINTIKRASDYEGSKIQKQLDKRSSSTAKAKPTAKAEEKVEESTPDTADTEDFDIDEDSDSPF